jgi:hypothetical protein
MPAWHGGPAYANCAGHDRAVRNGDGHTQWNVDIGTSLTEVATK